MKDYRTRTRYSTVINSINYNARLVQSSYSSHNIISVWADGEHMRCCTEMFSRKRETVLIITDVWYSPAVPTLFYAPFVMVSHLSLHLIRYLHICKSFTMAHLRPDFQACYEWFYWSRILEVRIESMPHASKYLKGFWVCICQGHSGLPLCVPQKYKTSEPLVRFPVLTSKNKRAGKLTRAEPPTCLKYS